MRHHGRAGQNRSCHDPELHFLSAVAGFGISVFWFLRGIVQKKKPTRKDLDKLKEAMVYRSIQLL
jgi:hypothetical protein